ncbi:hypothetical protein BsWGS_26485 [Bradybaena similaris]
MADILKSLTVSMLLMVIVTNSALASSCQKGQYLRDDSCHPCPVNTYMPEDNHDYKSCIPCQELSSNRDTHATIKWPCTAQSPTGFGCQEGYYRNSKDLTSEEECLPCNTCPGQYVGRLCDFLDDTVCCPSPNMTVDDDDRKCYTPSSLGKEKNNEEL